MFATLPSPSPPHVLSLPTPPRPLFSRDASLSHPRSMTQNGNSNKQKPNDSAAEQLFTSSSSPPSSPASYAQRYVSQIRNPASRVAGRASRDIRRNAFFNRIKQGRDNSMFNAREDGILWTEYITAKRRFEEEMARSAPEIENVEDEMMDTQEGGKSQGLQERNVSMGDDERNWDEQAALEEYLEQEEKYETFLEEMQKKIESDHIQSKGGEEEDYESIFADLASHYESGFSDPNDQMDMSHG